MIHALSYLLPLALLFLAFWSAGYVLERIAFRGRVAPELTHLARWALGIGFWMLAMFTCSVAGGLRAGVVWTLVAAILVAAAGVGGRQLRRSGWSRPPRPSRRHLPGVVRIAILTSAMLGLYLAAIAPSVSWDAEAYHLSLPKRYIEAGGFRHVPFSVYSHWPLNTEMLFSMAMIVKDYILAKLVHFGLGVLTLYAIHVVFRSHVVRAGAWLAMCFFLANGVVEFELKSAYVDVAHAFFFLAGFAFLARALDGENGFRSHLLLAGLACGIMAGVKLTGAIGAAILGTLLLPRLWNAMRAGQLRRTAGAVALCFVLPVVAPWTPWLIKSAWYTGNPIYPLLFDIFGGTEWNQVLARRIAAWHAMIGIGRTPGDLLVLPVRVILAGGDGYENFHGMIGSFWIVLLPLSIAVSIRNRLVRRCLGVTGLYFLYWALTSQQMRLLIPVMPFLSVAAGASIIQVVHGLVKRPSARAVGSWAGFGAAVVILIWVDWTPVSEGYRAVPKYGTGTEALKQAAIPPSMRLVNERVRPGDRLLLIATNQAFFCEREYFADSFFEASQIGQWLAPFRTAGDLKRHLRQQRVTHLVVDGQAWVNGCHRYYPPVVHELIQDLDHVELLLRSENHLVLALR